ncbi:MAG: ABC transporter substrate-binding protein [Candidatus Hatepunaea meridiana]|nr:ABC transporter substrate-binding protein [Candidatus Hatepunaea meridiana]
MTYFKLKNNNIIILTITTFLLFQGSTELFGQYSSKTGKRTLDQAYNELKSTDQNSHYEKTRELVKRFRHDFPNSKYESSVTFLAAKALLKLRLLDEARIEARGLMLKFPSSKYVDDSRFILAECDVLSECWDDAREHIGWIRGFSQDQELIQKARCLGDELDAYQKLLRSVNNKNIPSKTPKIGLVLPLGKPEADAANDFFQGFKLKWDELAKGEVIVYDSEADPIKAVRLAQMLIREDKVWSVIGGLDPAEASGLAAVAEAEKVPFLTTACGVGGLAGIGKYVFQGCADYINVGKALGNYAIQDLGLKRFGILAPLNQSGRQITQGFKEAITTQGGEILVEEAYYPGTQDFRTQFKKIREVGLRFAYDDSLRNYYTLNKYVLIDEKRFKPKKELLQPVLTATGDVCTIGSDTIRTLSDALLDSLWKTDHERLNEWMTLTKKELDSLEIPLKVYEGFLLVVEPGAIEITAPQFARFNLETQLLGDENWADRDVLSRVSRYTEGMIFAEPIALARGGEEYFQFSAEVSKLTDANLNRYHLEGERAARMMAFAVSRANNPESMRVALSQIRDLETCSGKVTLLKEERVDRHVTLTKYKFGEFEAVNE